MDMTWLSWLTNVVRLVGDLIPVLARVPPTHKGLKFRRMKECVVLSPGLHWYWPVCTEFFTQVVAQQTLFLSAQKLTTADGVAVECQGSITWKIRDSDHAIIQACVHTWDVENQIDDEAMGVYSDYIASITYDELIQRRDAVNNELTRRIRVRMREYGVNVKRAQLTSLARGLPILHIGQNSQ